MGSLEDLLRQTVDGYVVAINTGDHGATIRSLVGERKPIFVEKPLTTSVTEAEEMATLGAGLVFMMDKWRYHPGVGVMASLVKSGELGKVVGVHTRRNQRAWHHDCEEPWTLLPHDLAIVDELLGGVPPIRSVALDRVAGATYGLIARCGEDPWVVFECSGRSHATIREVSVFCEGGTVVLSGGYADSILVFRDKGRMLATAPEEVPCPGEWPLLAELREFVRYIAGGPAPRADVHSGLRHVELIDAMLHWSAP